MFSEIYLQGSLYTLYKKGLNWLVDIKIEGHCFNLLERAALLQKKKAEARDINMTSSHQTVIRQAREHKH